MDLIWFFPKLKSFHLIATLKLNGCCLFLFFFHFGHFKPILVGETPKQSLFKEKILKYLCHTKGTLVLVDICLPLHECNSI